MIASHFFSNRNGGYQFPGIFLSIFLGVGFGFITVGFARWKSVGVYTILAGGSSLDTHPLNKNKQLQIINAVLNMF
jgi:hypothetical protein